MNNQNESPFGNPRFLVVLVVTFLTLVGWQFYLSKKYPQQNSPSVTNTTSEPAKAQTAETTKLESKADSTDVKNVSDVNPILEEKIFKFEDDSVTFEVSSKGLGIKNFTLKKYTNRKNENIVFSSLENQGAIYLNDQVLNLQVTEISPGQYEGQSTVNGSNITVKLTYHPDLKYFSSNISGINGFEKLKYSFTQDHHIPENTSFFLPSFEQQDFIHIEAGSTKDENISRLKKEESLTSKASAVSLASVGTQYFSLAYINKAEILPSLEKNVLNSKASFVLEYNLKNTSVSSLNNIIFLGAKESDKLAAIDPQLPEIMNYGMFGFISKVLMKIMTFLHSFLGNWGLAIIALTLVVRAVLLPFNIMSFKSAQAMQKIKPKMDAVKEKYKDDPIKMNRETMNLMKENNANPLSGCLPMLIQIPIFFALWKAIGSSIEIYQQPFFGWITDLSHHDPFYVIPVLMGITMFLQQKLTPTTMDPMQAKILNFMPIIFTLFMLTLPSGLTIYNFVSALFGVIQQYLMLRDKNKTAVLA